MWGKTARYNKKFMKTLMTVFGQREFLSCWAEALYILYHMKSHRTEGTYWAKSNARQNLSIATERGILIRVRKGTYKFNK